MDITRILAFLSSLLTLIESTLLVTALWITISDSVQQIIIFYRWQAILLAVVTSMTAVAQLKRTDNRSLTVILVIILPLLPLFLAWIIEDILARATLGIPSLRKISPEQKSEAIRIWRKIERQAGTAAINLFLFIIVVTLSFLVAFQIITGEKSSSSQSQSLARIDLIVPLALHLSGLYNMVAKRDIISQVIGLLVMDHGLYLAVVKFVGIPTPAIWFVISLYFYTLITIVILVFLLPKIRQLFQSIDLDEITNRSQLKEE